MAVLIEPDDLHSVAKIARKFGYNPMYFTQLASQKKFKAWRIGNTWASTEAIITAYLRTVPLPGRPKTLEERTRRRKSQISP